jgi:SpoVK/Ycf46/Vps4 family AAA+-type ATPase
MTSSSTSHTTGRALDHALGALDVLRVVEVDQPLHDERLEQLERHLLGQAALVQLELRADDDDRTAGVVDALAEQVLAEAALLALEHVGQRLQRTVARAGDRTAAAAVVEQRVDGLLQHPLLVVDDDLGRTEVEQALEAVVAVDHAAVQVVQVGGREAATVELHHRAQVRRDDRDASSTMPIGSCGWLRNA